MELDRRGKAVEPRKVRLFGTGRGARWEVVQYRIGLRHRRERGHRTVIYALTTRLKSACDRHDEPAARRLAGRI